MNGKGVTGFFTFEAMEAVEGDDSQRQVVLIKPGMSKNRLKWEGSVLRAASEARLFDGARMFKDHNRKNPMDRRSDELVATIQGTKMGPEDRLVGTVKFHNKDFLGFAEEAKLGTSVVVHYEGERGRDNTGPFVRPTRITNVISTDWVPFPANEGTGIYAQESFDMKMTPEEFAQLKIDQPELFPAQESVSTGPAFDADAFRKEIAADIKGVVQTAVREVQDSMAQESASRKATSDSIDAYLKGVAVPASVKARIRSQFDGSQEYKEADLKLAVESAQSEISDILKSAGVTGPVVVGAGVTGEASGAPTLLSPGTDQSLDAVNRAFGGGKSAAKAAAAGKGA